MKRILLAVFAVCFLLFSTFAVAGTLAITVDAAPAPGLPAPKIVVIRGFTVYQRDVNWGDTWNLVVPTGNYTIHPLPVSDGVNFYTSPSSVVFVPAFGTVNKLITYTQV